MEKNKKREVLGYENWGDGIGDRRMEKSFKSFEGKAKDLEIRRKRKG